MLRTEPEGATVDCFWVYRTCQANFEKVSESKQENS